MRMIQRAILPLLAFSVAVAPVGAQARPSQQARAGVPVKATEVTTVEGITEYTLPNGLRVLLFPDPSKPTLTVNITYLVGSRHEGYGEAGMAHLLEHLAFKGSKKHPNITKELTDRGSRPNGTTWYDRTNYFETVPATDANLDWALDLEADRMINSFIARKDLESEFSVVRNEFEAGENSPVRVTLERVMEASFRWHGYGRSTIGNKADIENVPIDRLQAFYRKYYQPDNAVLVVAGKFDPAKALSMIERKFGSIPRPTRTADQGNLIHATYTTEPVQDGERFVTVRRVGDAQLIMMGHHVPASAHPDAAAIDVLSHVLTNNPSGRLYKALVDTKLAASVSGWSQRFKEPSLLMTWATLRQEQSLDSARSAMERALDALRAAPISEEEVDRAKTALIKNIELTLNNSEYVGYELTEWAAMGDWRLFFIHRDRIAKVTPADVQRVVAAYLKPANRTVAAFIPTATPDRAEIPETPNVSTIVAGYTGSQVVQAGEVFDASPDNIESRTKRSTLANGMAVTMLRKETRGNKVVARIALRHGTVESLHGKSQIASLTAGILSRGTTQLTREQVRDSLDKLKAQVFISGATNNIGVYIETLHESLVAVLDLVAQQLRSPRFDAAEFDKLKRERLASLEQIKSEPQYLGNLALNRKLIPVPKGHVLYTAMPDEQIADINAVTLDQLKEFHRDFYGATYADIAIVGDFEESAASAALQRLFADWKNPQPFERAERTYVAIDSTLEHLETPDKANAFFMAGQNIRLSDADPAYPAMALASFMAGGGFLNSRLATRLRQKEGLSYGAGAFMSVQSQDQYGTFTAYAIYAPQNVDKLIRAYREEMEKIVKDGFTKEEVEAARTGYVQGRSQGRANDDELMNTLIARRFVGRTLEWDEELERRIMALTPADVNSAVKTYIDLKHTVIVRAGDFKKHPPEKLTP